MKKGIVVLLILFTAGIGLPKKSYASGDFLKPASTFYFLQSWKESLGLFFSFSKESKLDYLEELNNKRINELQSYGNNDAQTTRMLVGKYENNYKKMELLVPEVQNKEQVAERIETNSVAQQETLARVYNQVPDQAKSAILNAEINSSKNVSAVLEKVAPEKVADYDQKVQQIQKAQMTEKIQKAEKESGNDGGNPEDRKPKPLNEIKGGKELNQLKDNNKINAGSEDSAGKAQPMQPAPMQSPSSQQ